MSASDEKIKRPLPDLSGSAGGCDCSQDPFAALPPELRPKNPSPLRGLRKTTCPGCGLVYWTSRATDLCADCERRGIKAPAAEDRTENGS